MNKYYPKIENQKELLNDLCKQRVYDLYEKPSQEVEQRLKYELDIIDKTDTTGIFIILNRVFTKLNIQPYQFGLRGITGNSIVAYLCGISNIDPVKYGLSQYVVFGTENNYKEPDIDINLNIKKDMKNRIVNEIENCAEIYKLIPARAKQSNGSLRMHPCGYNLVPIIQNFDDNDYDLLIIKILMIMIMIC